MWVDLEPDIAQHAPRGLRGGPLIVQQEKLLRLAVSDYIDRIVAGRGLRQHVITQPRPLSEVDLKRPSATFTPRLLSENGTRFRRHGFHGETSRSDPQLFS